MQRKTAAVFGIAATAVALVFTACDRGGSDVTAPRAAAAAPRGAAEQDLDGLPDLQVATATTAASWNVRVEDFVEGQCSVEEGNIPTGTHRSLRFSVLIDNIGDADLYVGDPLAHMDPNGDGNYSDQDGLFEFASCHKHFHFRNYATYELIRINPDGTPAGGTPVQSRKRGFCMLDTTPRKSDVSPPKPRYYMNCGNLTIHGNQGISTGYGDEYVKQLPGQLFLLSDPNEPVGPGDYIIRITANPPFAQKAGEVCPVKDSKGLCHMFQESNYENNVGDVRINIPDRVGRTGYGPGAGQYKEELDSAHHPEAHNH